MTILEQEESVLKYAVEQARLSEANKPGASLEDRYYAALLFSLDGNYERAVEILEELFPEFLPAGYKLAEIYKAFPDNEGITDRSKLIIERIKLEENERPGYKFGIKIIEPRHEADNFLDDIMNIVHFMEIMEIMGYLFIAPLEIRNPFFTAIKLAPDDLKKDSLSLQEKAASAWCEVLEKEVDPDELEDAFNGFSHFKSPARQLGLLIQNEVKAAYLDIKEKHKKVTRLNFKLYLSLNYRLYKEGLISRTEAVQVNDYIYISLSKLPDYNSDEIRRFLFTSFVDYFLNETLPVVPYILKINELITLVNQHNKGKQSQVIDFDNFITLNSNSNS